MPNHEHLERLKLGREHWNAWRASSPDVTPNLRNAQISGLDLAGYDFHDAYLKRACLKNTRLDRSKLREANLSNANLDGSSLIDSELAGVNLRGASLVGADLSNANLMTAMIVNANLQKAILSGARVYGVSAWDINLTDAVQDGLIANRPDQPMITVDDLEVAQFVFLLNDHGKLREVFNATTKRCVLILGRFDDGGLDILRALATELRLHGFLPIIFDFNRPNDRSLTETVVALAGLSAFVVADLTGRSVPQELQATVPLMRIPFVTILNSQSQAHSMVTDLAINDHFFYPPVGFNSVAQLIESVADKVIAPAIEYNDRRAAELTAIIDAR